MKKIALILMAGALLSLSACKNGKAPADNSGSSQTEMTKIEFDSVTSEVGLLKEGELRNVKFSFRNTGDKPLVLEHVKSHCNCTVIAYNKAPILPGGEGEITVAIHGSSLKHGHFNKTVDVFSNGSEKPVQLSLTGEFDGPDAVDILKEEQAAKKE